MARKRLTINVHDTTRITIVRDHAEGTTTRWTNVIVLDEDDNEYDITCFGAPQIIAPKEEPAKEAL